MLVAALLLYYSGRANIVDFYNVSFSYQKNESWSRLEFDNPSWQNSGRIFLSHETPQEIYVRQFFSAGSSSMVAHLTADDCIREVYLNGRLISSNANCSPGYDSRGRNLLLEPLNLGENLLSVKVLNFGGPSTLIIKEVKSGVPIILLLLILVLFVYLLHLKNLPFVLFYGFLFGSSLVFLACYLGFVDLPSGAIILIVFCVLFLLFIGESFLDNPAAVLVFFFILACGFLLPIFENIGYWGRGDWDAFYSLNYAPLTSFLDYHQLPLWNPYMCGGMTSIGDPEVSFYSPQVIPLLLFGLTAGIRLNILLHLTLALFGMWLLGKHFGLSGYSRLFPCFVYSLSSVYFKHMWEGHYTWLAHAWIPFVFYFFLEGLSDWKKLVFSGFFASLILFSGNINYLGYSLLLLGFYAIIETLRVKEDFKGPLEVKRKLKPILSFLFVLIVFTLISAVKLVPLIEHYEYSPRLTAGDVSLTFGELLTSLTDSEIGSKWHESNAYIGVLALSIIVLGILLKWRSDFPLLLLGVLFVLAYLNNLSPLPLWAYIQTHLPLYNSLRMIPRIVTMVILIGSLFGGLALHVLRAISKNFVKIAVIAVLLNLFIVTPSKLDEWFWVQPHIADPGKYAPEGFHQIRYTFENVAHGSSDMYGLILTGKGVLNCWSPVIPTVRALNYGDKNYRGEVYTINKTGPAGILEFTPSRVRVHVNASSPDLLVLNQNYYPGWRSSAGLVVPYRGLISTKVDPSIREVEFYYLPDSFIIGALITLITLLLITILSLTKYKHSS
ncbi:MAG: hypothetical protein V1703_04700 [Candidatus Altiarchaeota archaeon]